MGRYGELNLRDIGGIPFADGSGTVPKGLFLRSGKLSMLTKEECSSLFRKYGIKCVIDLRTPVESAEFPDPMEDGMEFLQIPLLKDAAVGITHETGSDPMTIMRNLRKNPEQLKKMIPNFKALYQQLVTDDFSRSQLEKVLTTLKTNAENGRCTLFHCTAGKDRTGIVCMALLKAYGVGDEEIIKDYMRTNRSAFLPTIKKCIAILLLTRSLSLAKLAYNSFMADRNLIEIAIKHYDSRP